MSISSIMGNDINFTELPQALKFFTDRNDTIKLFCLKLHNAQTPNKILFFYGSGGNGKTLLFDYLQQNYCWHFPTDIWNLLKDQNGELFKHQLLKRRRNHGEVVPFARLDFSAPDRGDEQPKVDYSALMMLRRQLALHNYSFPLFDFAVLLYLHKTNQLTSEKRQNLFPANETDFIAEIANLISETNWGTLSNAILKLFSRRWGEKFDLYLKKRNLDEDTLKALMRKDARKELIYDLPALFAEDLNTVHAETERRLVLFFDTHESFWESGRDLSDELFFRRDEWLRCLLRTLDLESGIVVCVAGRDLPRWAETDICPIPNDFIDAHLVGNLSGKDAREYLNRLSADNPDLFNDNLIEAVIKYTRGTEEDVHPFYLGLAAEVVMNAAKQGTQLTAGDFEDIPETEKKHRKLVNRLLKYVSSGIHNGVIALSACRSFDFKTFRTLGEKLQFQSFRSDFDQIIRFSFVDQLPSAETPRFRLHNLLRVLLPKLHPAEVQTAHKALESHYRQAIEDGNEVNRIEAIYHRWQSEPENAIKEWLDTFKQYLDHAQYNSCHSLLAISRENTTPPEYDRGEIPVLEGKLFIRLSRLREAQAAFQQAEAECSQYLIKFPDIPEAYKTKGDARHGVADVLANQANHEAAQNRFEAAIESYDEALRRAPGYVDAHNNKGNALNSLGNLLAGLAQHDEARNRYMDAIESFDEALRHAPDNVLAHSNKGNALQKLGKLLAGLAQHGEARNRYMDAVESFDEALRRAPDNVDTHKNKGNALKNLGNLLAGLAQHDEARNRYVDAIESFDEALRHAPDYVYAHNNKGNALNSLGNLFAGLAQHDVARNRYMDAIENYDEALRRAPDYIDAHNNKGLALKRLGDLFARRDQHDEARNRYMDAIESYDEALRRAPDDVDTHKNKGNAQQSLGDLFARRALHDEARNRYMDAIESFDEALRHAPDDVDAHYGKVGTLRKLGDLKKL